MASSPPNTALFDPPPPYEQFITVANADVDTNPPTANHAPDVKNSSNKAQEEWKYVKQIPNPNYKYYPPDSYWAKITRDPIDNMPTKVSLVSSEHRQEKGVCDGPDAFFTCMLQPRSPKTSHEYTSNVLGRIVTASRSHRGHADEYCDCVLWDNDHENTSHCSRKFNSIWPVRFVLWLEWMAVKSWKRQHDWLCSCTCFDSCV
jgi:hypothetical protein